MTILDPEPLVWWLGCAHCAVRGDEWVLPWRGQVQVSEAGLSATWDHMFVIVYIISARIFACGVS